jgi:surfeit locus 1 family protein
VTRSRARRSPLLPVLCLFAAIVFAALGVWQIERRAWKLDLIARVDARVRAPAVALRPASHWRSLERPGAEYLRVTTHGRFDHGSETRVDALTERGPGYWVMTPLKTAEGTILVNRGFVPTERADPAARHAGHPDGDVPVAGLIRLTEPGGRFLRGNRPDQDRWFSRDVAAIARARGLGPVAPFFIDADATPNPGGFPVGGLTVVHFRNTHLIYALTWFALAVLSLAGLVLARRPVQDDM